jgi:hypothetical protein
MTGTQAPNDGGHLGMSSQQDQMELELGENNRDGEGYSDSLYGADSQENGFVVSFSFVFRGRIFSN